MDAQNPWWVSELLAEDCEKAWTHTGWEETKHKWCGWSEHMKKKDEKEKNGGDASAKGGEDDQECRRECQANDVEGKSTDLEERGGRSEIAGSLRSKKKRMVKTLAMQ